MMLMCSGHRPQRVGGYIVPNPTEQWIRSSVRSILSGLLVRDPEITMISGMALGVDQLVAEECFNLHIPFIAAIPFTGQEQRWPNESQIRFCTLLKQAREIIVVDQLPEYHVENVKSKFILRDKWMVDHAGRAIVVWDGIPAGGTYQTLVELQKRNTRFILINPTTRTISLGE